MIDQTPEAEMQTISAHVPPIPRSQLEEGGYSLLLVDLLRMPGRFSYNRYRLDVIGFLLAWLWVVLLLLLGWWIARIGA